MGQLQLKEDREMSNAESTVRLAIECGLAQSAHKTRLTCEMTPMLTNDLINALFRQDVLWAVSLFAAEKAA